MFLTEKSSSPFSQFFSPNPKNPPPNSFEQTLITRLTSLLPFPASSPSIPLSYLSRTIDLLTLTLADSTALISDPSLSIPDYPALACHLDSIIALLDACNAISATIDRILHRCLFVRRLLSLNRIDRARAAIAEWEAANFPPSDLGRLQFRNPNRGKGTDVRRAIYAVEAVSDLVVRLAREVLGKKDGFVLGVFVSGDFAWADVYNEVLGKICCGGIGGEIEVVKRRVKKLGDFVVGDDGGVTEGLRVAVCEAEEAVEELTEGMDGLGKAVNGLFRSSLESREAALQCFRKWDGRCK